MGNVEKLVCTVCGEKIVLEKAKENSQFSFRQNKKKYKIYEYKCPFCSNKIFISEKFIEDINN